MIWYLVKVLFGLLILVIAHVITYGVTALIWLLFWPNIGWPRINLECWIWVLKGHVFDRPEPKVFIYKHVAV